MDKSLSLPTGFSLLIITKKNAIFLCTQILVKMQMSTFIFIQVTFKIQRLIFLAFNIAVYII